MEEQQTRLFSKEAWRGIALALIAVVIGQIVLAWQYYRLEEKRLPLIEQQLAEQREELELQGAKKVILSFLEARVKADTKLAIRFLTENTVLQIEKGELLLEEQILDYKVSKIEKVGNKEFWAQVAIQKEEGLPGEIEILRVVKILDSYYIDSVEIAG